jgi:hypothetical protein
MGLLGRLGLGRGRSTTGHGSLDRRASDEDVAQLVDFVRTRAGVEFYVEPKTNVTATTVLAIAADGEWIRRRVDSAEEAGKVADKLRIPLYEAMRVGYPQRMRDWNAAHPERKIH